MRIQFFIFLICAASILVEHTNAQTPQLTRGPYLQQVTSESIIIRWRTDIPSSSRIDYGITLDYGNSVTDPSLTTEHKVKLTGLNPGTKYYYTIGWRSDILQSGFMNNFYTAPSPGSISPVRIWATGDFGNGLSTQAAVRDAFSNYSQLPVHLWIWLGDNAYNSGLDIEYQNFVFNMYPSQLKQIPVYPAPGNHDYGQVGYQSSFSLTTSFPYFSIFTVPQQGEAGGIGSGTPKYYSFNYSNIHFISLDSYGAMNDPGSAMYKWLAKDLAANTQRWTIVYFHHPPYTKGTHDSDHEIELIDMRTHIVPLLETFKTDLVLSGHSHSNERSYMMKGHYGASDSFDPSMKIGSATNHFHKSVPYNGTVYAICGTSGQVAGGPQTGGPMPCMYYNDFDSNCSMVIDVNGDFLSAKYLSSTGDITDEFTITRDGPEAPLKDGNASCEISYHPGDAILYFTLYLTQPASFSAAIYNLLGEKVTDFEKLPDSLTSGYHVQSELIRRTVHTYGIYLVKVQVGEHVFSKKIFISVP